MCSVIIFLAGNSKLTGEGDVADDDVVKKSINEKFCQKSIDIFTYKQRILSIDMKTKVVQHVESE